MASWAYVSRFADAHLSPLYGAQFGLRRQPLCLDVQQQVAEKNSELAGAANVGDAAKASTQARGGGSGYIGRLVHGEHTTFRCDGEQCFKIWTEV